MNMNRLMMQKNVFQIAVALIVLLGACSKKSFDGAGVYKGMETDDGKETVTVLSLEPDLSFRMQTASTEFGSAVAESKGKFSLSGDNIVLTDSNTGAKTTFKASENSLQQTGKSLSLFKMQPESVVEKYWKLVEIQGKPVVLGENAGREPFIILRAESGRVNGNTGCNTIMGSYELEPAANRIRFSQMASTQMMCLSAEVMEIESEMLKMFGMVDNYSLSPDGKYLSLNRARMAPLARFEAVYLR